MDKKNKRKNIRPWIQGITALLSNSWLTGFFKGTIFKGATKSVCLPGLNCYSCPGALGACPLGALQNTLTAAQYKFALYVSGLLVAFGAICGRFICGFLCPFGWIQELIHKIPFPKKFKKLPAEKILRLLKHLILIVFVILLPLFFIDTTGIGKPWFCAYICPAGTLEAGIPLVLLNSGLRQIVGFLYAWKLLILAIILFLALILWRPFCRYLCPLGAIYGYFNPIALIRFKVDPQKCVQCGACQAACPMDLPIHQKPNPMDCMRCGKCKDTCPTDAIQTIYPFKKN
ncbi:MAG: 4Fe-4S binding protein [Clostridia bacterium]|nr:4Fe-4S binding protein [Clostridia bacterium]